MTEAEAKTARHAYENAVISLPCTSGEIKSQSGVLQKKDTCRGEHNNITLAATEERL